MPKNFNNNYALSFGNENSKIKVFIFEDFKCKNCKKLSYHFTPVIKENYLDSDKINYNILPLSFVCGSKTIANAAFAVYQLNKNEFFNFLKKVSYEELESKEDIFKIVKELNGINFEIFKELVNKEVFNEYLDQNFSKAKEIMKKNFKVPAIYINCYLIDEENFSNII